MPTSPKSTNRALISRPPEQALDWVVRNAGHGAKITSLRRLRGGVSATVHAISLVDTEGAKYGLVLRRFVREDWLAREPDLATHEACALRLLEPTAVPAPQLVAVDEYGRASGIASVLMTRLTGHVDLNRSADDFCLMKMAEAMRLIHSITPTRKELPWEYEPYSSLKGLRVPGWSSRPEAWKRAIAIVTRPRPNADYHLIHRDYHPANVLWRRGRLTGVIDWVNACRGPAGVDLGHCRRNLAMLYGVDIADRFLAAAGNVQYDPYWDVITAIDALPEAEVYGGWRDLGFTHLSTELVRRRLDDYMASVVARL